MTSAIDPTVPVYGTPTTASVRANFQAAHDEITALQSGKAPLASPPFTGNPTAPTPAQGDNDTSIATTAFVTSAISTAGQNSAAAALNNVGRNLIHNSMMNVNQRGASQPYSASGAYTLDRWQLGFTGGACTTAQYGLDDALRAPIGDEAANLYMSNSFTGGGAAGDSTSITQSIEDVRRLAGKTVTLSCWAIASAAGMKLGLGLWISYGTGGSPSPAFYVPAVPVTLTGAFARYSATLVVPSAAGKTFGTNRDDRSVVCLWLSSGANNNANAGGIGVQSGGISFWGVQLEVGSTVTPLEKPDPQQDLANCLRFYQICEPAFAGYGTASMGMFAGCNLLGSMRAAPTLTLLNNYCSNGAFTGLSWSVSTIIAGMTVGGAGAFTLHVVCSASADF